MKPKAQTTKVKIGKLDYIKIKNIHASKVTINRAKRKPTELTSVYFSGHKVPMTVYLLLSTFQSFLMLFYVKDPGFSVSLSSRKRGKYVHYISLETEPSPRIYFFFWLCWVFVGAHGALCCSVGFL